MYHLGGFLRLLSTLSLGGISPLDILYSYVPNFSRAREQALAGILRTLVYAPLDRPCFHRGFVCYWLAFDNTYPSVKSNNSFE